MMATCTPWKKSMRPPLMLFAATAKMAPTRIGQHQEPIRAGMAASSEHTAMQRPPSPLSFSLPRDARFTTSTDGIASDVAWGASSPELPQSRHSGSSAAMRGLSRPMLELRREVSSRAARR